MGTRDEGFIDKVLHDTVLRNVTSQFKEEVASHRNLTIMISRILAVHGLASCAVTVPGYGTFLCLNVERLSRGQLTAVEEIVMSSPPPMPAATAEAIVFNGMEEANGEFPEDN